MLSGWFSFWEYVPLMDMSWHSQLDKTIIPEWVPVRPAFAKKTADAVQNAYHNIYRTPLWGGVLSYGLYVALLPVFALTTALRNWKKPKREVLSGVNPSATVYCVRLLACAAFNLF